MIANLTRFAISVFTMILLGCARPDTSGTSDFLSDFNGKWGYISRSGDFVIEPRFKDVGDFSDGLAKVQVGRKIGYVNHSGHLVIDTRYELGGDFSQGLCPVMIEGKWGYIDKSGKLAIEAKFARAKKFSEGLAAVGISNP